MDIHEKTIGPENIDFSLKVSSFSIRFNQLSMSWMPGSCLKTLLETMRFVSTECELVATHGTPNRLFFHNSLRASISCWPQAQPPGGK